MNDRATEHKIILVKRKTRLEELVVRYNTVQQAKFTIERLGADFSDYLAEDGHYHKAAGETLAELAAFGRVQVIEREYLPNFIFGADDIIVVLGQDGLVANTLKYVTEQPVIGVNPDPLRWDGILLPFTVKDLRLILPEVLHRRRSIKEVTLAKAELNDGQTLYGVNDLFIGRKTHVSARYQLTLDHRTEQQSSSGVIVSTGMGATGWFKSILAGASGIVSGATKQQVAIDPERNGLWPGTRHICISQSESHSPAERPPPGLCSDRSGLTARCASHHRCRRTALFSATAWKATFWNSTPASRR
ncbi:hypothetical protein GCM10010911_49020 [Paenibacillus nasutitermitis]|uniref:Sugar kinase n=1 Tax=Paenibacillus nasutitermitis TaxID=1652958 RepID=A0A917DYT6_9BACL|nr:hypothetical protein GCM10010911_49020 [Paenibacillus nasutitermitis]